MVLNDVLSTQSEHCKIIVRFFVNPTHDGFECGYCPFTTIDPEITWTTKSNITWTSNEPLPPAQAVDNSSVTAFANMAVLHDVLKT